MSVAHEHSVEVVIGNQTGFHVRPVQRFAQLAQFFQADVEVEIRSQSVPGKSMLHLLRLGGRHGDRMRIAAQGEDARQCVDVLRFLAESDFFVEDNMDPDGHPDRHVVRLARLACCFNSDITVVLGDSSADAKQVDEAAALGLEAISEPQFVICGEDARQAHAVLGNLVDSCFYVEDKMGCKDRRAS